MYYHTFAALKMGFLHVYEIVCYMYVHINFLTSRCRHVAIILSWNIVGVSNTPIIPGKMHSFIDFSVTILYQLPHAAKINQPPDADQTEGKHVQKPPNRSVQVEMMKPEESEWKPEEIGVIKVFVRSVTNFFTLVIALEQYWKTKPIDNVTYTEIPESEGIQKPEPSSIQIVMMSPEKSRRRNSQDAGRGCAFLNDIWNVRVGFLNMVWHQTGIN